MMKGRLCLPGLMIVLAAGCAGVTVSRVTPGNEPRAGIRFYRPHPYLWVTKDKDTKGNEGSNLKGVIIWLPDKSEEYAIRVRSGLGSTNLKFTLENGWNLTEFGEVRDSKVPETIEALGGSLEGVTALVKAARPGEEKGELMPGLYAFVFDARTGLVSGLVPVLQFK